MSKKHVLIPALLGICLSGPVLAAETDATFLPVAETVSASKQDSVPLVDGRALVAGLGAVGGVVLLNYMSGGMRAMTGAIRTGLWTGAGSRFYSVTSAIGGALVADYFYRRSASNP